MGEQRTWNGKPNIIDFFPYFQASSRHYRKSLFTNTISVRWSMNLPSIVTVRVKGQGRKCPLSHGSELSEWALPTKRRRHCSFSTSLCSTRRSLSSTQQDELWKPCIRCRRADVLEQTSSRNPGKRLAAEFQVSA